MVSFRLFMLGLVCGAFLIPPSLFAQQSSEQAVVVHFQAGQQAMKNGQWELAAAEFNKVLRLSPNLVEAQVNLGLARHLLGQYGESVAVLAKASQQNPELVPANLFLGIGYLKLGSHREAVAPLERVVRLEPTNREARRALVSCRLADDDYRRAASEFKALFTLEPDKTEAWFQLARDYTDVASRLVRRMSLEHRRTAWGHRLAGDLYHQSRRWGLAAQEFQEALAVDAAQPGLHTSLGSTYLNQTKLEEAAAEFRSALRLDANNEQARLGLAEVSLANGASRTALEHVAQIWQHSSDFFFQQSSFPTLEMRPEQIRPLVAELQAGSGDAPTLFLLSALYRLAGDAEKAREHYAAFLNLLKGKEHKRFADGKEEVPERLCQAHRYAACAQALESRTTLDVNGYVFLGNARLVLGQHEAASDAFAAALALVRDSAELIYRLARSYQTLADDCFSHVEELAPDSWQVHEMRANTYKLRYEDEQAILEYQLAARLKPDEPELHQELGVLYLAKNALDEARAELEKSLKLDPSRARTLYLLGRLYVSGREQEKAIPYLQKALRYDANLLEARATLGKAYLRAGKPEAAITELEKAVSLDFYGDLHYLLYQAYRDLGKVQLARSALSRSEEMRKNSVARDREKLERWMKD